MVCVCVCVYVRAHTHTHYLEEKCTITWYYHKTHLVNLGADIITARCNLSLIPLDLLFFAVHLLLKDLPAVPCISKFLLQCCHLLIVASAL